MLSKRMGDAVDVDDELAALEAEMLDEQAAAMPKVPTVRFMLLSVIWPRAIIQLDP